MATYNPVSGKIIQTPEEKLAAMQKSSTKVAKKIYYDPTSEVTNPSTIQQAMSTLGITFNGSQIPTSGAGVIDQSTLAAQQAAQQAALAQQQQAALDAQKKAQGQSAYDLLLNEFKQYGLESLVEPLKGLIQEGASGATMALALQNTDAYKKRFSANQARINAGLRPLSPAEYLGMEDQYQNLMRQYGLPESYYTKGELGIQEGFNKLLANDISASELEDRLIQAQQKVNNANPEVKQALSQFYPGITDSDILAYTLDPKNALTDIKRKVAAAEIGGAALAQGLGTSRTTAEQLAASGITKAQATQGYGTIAGYLPTAQQLSDIYSMQSGGPYTQSTAEAEVFGTAGSAEAERLRKKLAKLEQSQFSGQSGTAGSGALSRDRAITNYQLGMSGSGQF